MLVVVEWFGFVFCFFVSFAELLPYYCWVNEYGRERLDLWIDDIMTAASPQCSSSNLDLDSIV